MSTEKYSIIPRPVIHPTLYRLQPFNIVYIDDHQVYTDGMKRCMMWYYPNIDFTMIRNGNDALSFMTERLQKNIKTDMLITDINHPGMQGHIFIPLFRQMEKLYGVKKQVPVIIISMLDDPSMVKYLQPFVNSYLFKNVTSERILECFDSIFLKTK